MGLDVCRETQGSSSEHIAASQRGPGSRTPTYSPHVSGFRVGAADPAVSCLCVGLRWSLLWKSRQWAADSTDQVHPGHTVGVHMQDPRL